MLIPIVNHNNIAITLPINGYNNNIVTTVTLHYNNIVGKSYYLTHICNK